MMSSQAGKGSLRTNVTQKEILHSADSVRNGGSGLRPQQTKKHSTTCAQYRCGDKELWFRTVHKKIGSDLWRHELQAAFDVTGLEGIERAKASKAKHQPCIRPRRSVFLFITR